MWTSKRLLWSKRLVQEVSRSLLHTSQNAKAKRVVLGMSGGVDSSVAAHLLKSKGFEVIGVFMKNWDIVDEQGICQADKEAEDAEYVCNKLQIPFKHVSFVKEYWSEVFNKLVEEYQAGLTPNPDVDCNRFIKFGHFHDYCKENIDCNAIATGHYARTSFGDFLEDFRPNQNVQLLIAMDRIKDQTFFLSQVPQEALRSTMFPLGHMTKDVVKKVAISIGLEKIADKKESMGICFVGKRKSGFQEFLKEYTQEKPGAIIDMETYKEVGEHQGCHLWTLGQGLKIPGKKYKSYVCQKDVEKNLIYVCYGEQHPALFCENFFTDDPYWIDQRAPDALSNRSKDQVPFRIAKIFKSQNFKKLVKACLYSS